MFQFKHESYLFPAFKNAEYTIRRLQSDLYLPKSVPYLKDIVYENMPLNHRLLRVFTYEHEHLFVKVFSKKIHMSSLSHNEFVTHENLKMGGMDFYNLGKCLKVNADADTNGYTIFGGFYIPGKNEYIDPDFLFYRQENSLPVKAQGIPNPNNTPNMVLASFSIKFVRRNTFSQVIHENVPYRNEFRMKLSNKTFKIIQSDARKLGLVDLDILRYRNTLRAFGGCKTVAGSRLPHEIVFKIAEAHLKIGKAKTLMAKQTLDIIKDRPVINSLLPQEWAQGSPSMSPFVAFIKAKVLYGESNTSRFEVITPHGIYWPSRGRSPRGKGVSYQWRKKGGSKRKRESKQ